MNPNNLFLIFVLFCVSHPAFASDQSGTHAFEKADSLLSIGEYSSARSNYEIAKKYFQNNGPQDSLLHSIVNIAFTYSSEKNDLGLINFLETTIYDLEVTNTTASFLLAYCFNLAGFTKIKHLNYSDGLADYERALSIFEDIDANGPNVAFTYRNAALIYMRRLDYSKTKDYLNRGLKSDSTNLLQSTIYGNLAKTAFFLNNHKLALSYFQKAIQFPFRHLSEKGAVLTIGADIYLEHEKLDSAILFYNEAISIFEQFEGRWALIMDTYISLAKIAIQKRNDQEALQYFQKALEESNKYPSKKRETAGLYADWGEYYLDQNQLDSALHYFQKAIIQVIPNFNSMNLANHPSKDDLYPESWIMTASSLKGEALRKRYDISRDIQDLKIAGTSYLLALDEIDVLRATYGTDRARLYIGDFSNQYYEQAIEIFYLLYQQTNNEAYLDQAFQLMERSKAALLKEAQQQNKAILIAGIPDSMIKQEEALRWDISEISNALTSERLRETDSDQSEITNLELKLTKLEEKHRSFLKTLEARYPQYKALVSSVELSGIKTVQTQISKNQQAILEYFWGSESAYLLWVTPTTAGIKKLDNFSEMDVNLGELVAILHDNNKLLQSPDRFNQLSYALFGALGLSELPENAIQKLTIVPDGPLHYLPFEILLRQPASNPNTFDVDYLIKTCAINYAYTALENQALGMVSNTGSRFLKMAPEFAQNQRGLTPLLFSELETGRVRPNTTLVGTQAQSDYFKSQAGHFDFIHLSTHAEANPHQAVPHIEFIDTALLLPEIYAMKFHSDLVVLSACETGVGEFAKGEGVMSLARGFLFAGAKSLVSSLWKVNEKSTATIFANFYRALSKGEEKSEALRRAKLQYLKEAKNDLQKSPYYWAGFTLTGQDGTVTLPDQRFIYGRLLLFILFGIALIWLGRAYWPRKHSTEVG